MKSVLGLLLLLFAAPSYEVMGQSVQMDSIKSGFVGSQVELRCQFITSRPPVEIVQVTWLKLLNGTKQNVAIANPALGVSVLPPFKDRVVFKNPDVRRRTPLLEDITIVFNNLRLSDEAAYTCKYTTFPAGEMENMVSLTIFARPLTRMTLTTPTIIARATKRKMTVATCVSANSKPPSIIKWKTQLKGEFNLQETCNPNGTVTVRSSYILVPSRELHGQKLTCIVSYRNERITDSVILNIQSTPLSMTAPTPATTLATNPATNSSTTLPTNLTTNPATTHQSGPSGISPVFISVCLAPTLQSGPSDEASLWSISPVFITVWLAEIIVLASLLVGGFYLRRKRTHTAGENQEVELSPASMSRSRRRRRGQDEGEGPGGDNQRESVIYEIDM